MKPTHMTTDTDAELDAVDQVARVQTLQTIRTAKGEAGVPVPG